MIYDFQKNRSRFVFIAIFCLLSMLVLCFISPSVSALDGDEALANQYAPIFYFEKEETCYPVDVSYHLINSDLFTLDSETAVDTSPETLDLSDFTEDIFYLDNQAEDVISSYQSSNYTNTRTVYYSVNSSSGTTVIQYWMFYAFNKGELNQHEGDWEMVQVVFSGGDPSWVAYSQHHSGQWATWDQVEHDGDSIKVYVARGSHANYLRSYSGKIGIASDIVGDNGEILKPGSYTLVNLEDQDWLDFAGRWGEVGQGSAEAAASSSILGKAGPHGPKFREGGAMWNEPVGWGKGLPQASDMMFLAEWFFYNFLTIFIIITAIVLAVTILLILRRHKKYGLGPRVVSMFYIDGLNLKSIGNILCIVGIIIAIVGLFSNWYIVSYDFTSSGDLEGLETGGWQNLLEIDGLNGIQLVVPGESGPMPVGTFVFPFSLLLGIGIVFLIIATIGVSQSKKIGYKYIWRGIRLFTPIILIIVVIMSMGNIAGSMGEDLEGAETGDIFSSISSSPLGGDGSFDFTIVEEDVEETATLNMKWGLGLGGILLLLAGILIIVSGVIEIIANTVFFQTKIPVGKPKKEKRKKSKQPPQQPMQQQAPPPVPPPAPPQTPLQDDQTQQPDGGEINFCPECGAELKKDGEFCAECGYKAKNQRNQINKGTSLNKIFIQNRKDREYI